ncbi:hypothetical protein EDL96_08410 [Kocuria soli]|uniref:Uncharacterized protein n=1 Tax=Kocuria soli TaxID=2485125 RepID=A0A3N4AAP3_9MICC|nr:hypothetical protein [Kocuria soli]ROZ62795.1 hypothetical protein EDL96_08410 [Kocuria soli]
MTEYLAVLLPSIGVGLIFWFVMRAIMRADRGEREAEKAARSDAEQWYQQVRAREGHDIAQNPGAEPGPDGGKRQRAEGGHNPSGTSRETG